MFRVGVVGYSSGEFDAVNATTILKGAFQDVLEDHPSIIVVSGLTDIGIPAIAYRLATKFGCKTVGIACRKAYEYPLYPVTKRIIIGDDWGDESSTFLNSIDMLIRVGGGKQSIEETKIFKKTGKPVVEYDLPTSKTGAVETSAFTGTSGLYTSFGIDTSVIPKLSCLCNEVGVQFTSKDTLHVTLLYSPFDIPTLLPLPKLPIVTRLVRFDMFGPNRDIFVGVLDSDYIQRLHARSLKFGGDEKYPEYKPHITLATDVVVPETALAWGNFLLREPLEVLLVSITIDDVR